MYIICIINLAVELKFKMLCFKIMKLTQITIIVAGSHIKVLVLRAFLPLQCTHAFALRDEHDAITCVFAPSDVMTHVFRSYKILFVMLGYYVSMFL
jgi:hypothetical protein